MSKPFGCGGCMRRYRPVVWVAMALLGAGSATLGQEQKTAPTTAAKADQPPPEVVQQDSGEGSPDHPVLQHRNPRYRVNRDDVLQISFPLSPELHQKAPLHPDGYITLQNIGSVYIAGMTVPEVVVALKKASANILHDPI